MSMRKVTETVGANRLLDAVMGKLLLRSDAALSRALEVPPPVISKLRHDRLRIGPTMLIRMHEVTGLPIRELKDYLKEE
jgi:plasmid maintenance system antidote protein VapI